MCLKTPMWTQALLHLECGTEDRGPEEEERGRTQVLPGECVVHLQFTQQDPEQHQ